jgi:hypothetical protein
MQSLSGITPKILGWQVNREMHMVTFLNQKAGKKPVPEKEIFL